MKEDESFAARVVEIFGPLADLRRAGHPTSRGDWELVEESAPARDAAVLGRRSLAAVAEAVAAGMRPTSAEAAAQLAAAEERAGWSDVDRYLSALRRCVEAYVAQVRRLLAAPPEAPEDDAPYGKYAFANQRDDVPREDDTPEERRVWTALSRHVVDNIPMDSSDAQQLRRDLAAGRYKKVLHTPLSRWLFRGMRMSDAALRRLLRLEKDGGLPDEGSAVVDREMKARRSPVTPARGSFSWSDDLSAALKFAGKTDDLQRYAVVLVASAGANPDSFLAGTDGFYRLSDLKRYSREKEAIGLGDILVHKVYWQRLQRGEEWSLPIEEGRLEESILRLYVRGILAEVG